jgi:hypothetical protein
MARDDDDKFTDEPRNRSDDRDDDDRPRKQDPRPEDKDLGIEQQAMPMRMIGAIIASIFWGGLLLYGSCVSFSRSAMVAIDIHNARAIGGEGLFGTLAASQLFVSLLAAALLVGGVLMLMRKGFAKYMVMGVPAAIVVVEMATSVLCLIISSGVFLAHYNFDFLITSVFSLAVGGLNTYLLLDKEIAKAFK